MIYVTLYKPEKVAIERRRLRSSIKELKNKSILL